MIRGLRDELERAAGAAWLAPARLTMMALSSPWVVTYQILRIREALQHECEGDTVLEPPTTPGGAHGHHAHQ